MAADENNLTFEEIQAGFALLRLDSNEVKSPTPVFAPDEPLEGGWFRKFSLLEPGSIISSPNACNQTIK